MKGPTTTMTSKTPLGFPILLQQQLCKIINFVRFCMICLNLFHFQSFLFFSKFLKVFLQNNSISKTFRIKLHSLPSSIKSVLLRKIFILTKTNTFIESTLLNKTKYSIVAEFPEIYAHNKKVEEKLVVVLMNH